MSDNKMHDNEIYTDEALVGRLLATQFPELAGLPIKAVQSAGTDNAIYRLGNDKVVRMPRIKEATTRLGKERLWLPKLAPFLPLAIPVPLAKGKPNAEYPFHWSIYQWIEGENTTIEKLDNPVQAATELAQFIAALQKIDTTDAPPPGIHNFYRGEPLANRDSQTRAAIVSLHGIIDTDAANAAWEAALQAPVWNESPVWIHGDLQSGNLLAQQGRLKAVIDFGGLGVGDPACDLQVAWNLFSSKTRTVFREMLEVDDATWIRGRAWALSCGLIALPYYQKTNPVLAGISRYAIEEVLTDFRSEHGIF